MFMNFVKVYRNSEESFHESKSIGKIEFDHVKIFI